MNCAHRGTPLPAGSRRDRVCCTSNCGALASYYRRKNAAAPPPRWQHPALSAGNPALRAAAARAQQLGEARGWDRSAIRLAPGGLAVVPDGRTAGERVSLTQIRTRTPRHASSPRAAEVPAGPGLLDDDTTPAIRSRADRRTGELPDGFAQAVRAWLLVLPDGDARARPRSHGSICVCFSAVRPFTQRRPADYDHLREVTPADVRAALDPLPGRQLRTAIAALRSLFPVRQKTRPCLHQPRYAPEDQRSRVQPAADGRRRDPRRRAGGHRPRTAADRRPGRGPRRPLRCDPAPHAG